MENMTLQTVERALMILEIISTQSRSQKQLEEITGFNRSAVRRLVFTLLDNGYIEKDVNTNKFKLGLKVVELSSLRLNQVELKTEAVPFLRELSMQTNQVCHMGILLTDEVVYIEKIQPINSISMYSSIGTRLPVYCSAMGKVLLAGLLDDEVFNLLKRIEIKKVTYNTHTDIENIMQQVRTARKVGYAIDNAENEENIWCIGVPIYDYKRMVVAAISTSGNNKEIVKEGNPIIEKVKKTALEISKRIGFSK